MSAALRAVASALLLLTLIVGVIYPISIYGLAQLLFPTQANGSLVLRDGRIIGSQLIGQHFNEARYFWGRPSATAPTPYNAAASSGSNLAASNPRLAQEVSERTAQLAQEHADSTGPVPLELLTTSGSGLDPHLSVPAMLYQVERVAAARGMDAATVRTIIEQHIEPPLLGLLGPSKVNVLAVNLALDEQQRSRALKTDSSNIQSR